MLPPVRPAGLVWSAYGQHIHTQTSTLALNPGLHSVMVTMTTITQQDHSMRTTGTQYPIFSTLLSRKWSQLIPASNRWPNYVFFNGFKFYSENHFLISICSKDVVIPKWWQVESERERQQTGKRGNTFCRIGRKPPGVGLKWSLPQKVYRLLFEVGLLQVES